MQTTDVREGARQAVEGSRNFLTRQIDDQSTRVGERVGTVAGELRGLSDQLRQAAGPLGGVATPYVDRGADLVDQFGQYLKDADTGRLISDLEEFARRQPLAVAAGALVLGFAASRFLKTSSARRYYGGDGTSESGYAA